MWSTFLCIEDMGVCMRYPALETDMRSLVLAFDWPPQPWTKIGFDSSGGSEVWLTHAKHTLLSNSHLSLIKWTLSESYSNIYQITPSSVLLRPFQTPPPLPRLCLKKVQGLATRSSWSSLTFMIINRVSSACDSWWLEIIHAKVAHYQWDAAAVVGVIRSKSST